MGVRSRFGFALIAAGALVSGCTGHGPFAAPPGSIGSALDRPPTAHALAVEAAARAQVEAKLRAGYIFQVSAAVHSVVVTRDKGPTFTMSPGDFIDVKLVRNTEPKYRIRGNHEARTRTAQSTTDECGDGCDSGNGDGGPPAPGPTPPPNYGPCASSGGATWYNNATGEGGCTPRGSSRPLSCGTWSWSSRGRGTLNVPGIGVPISDLDYVIDNGDGSCRAGNM